jgi:hypothetical protein
VNKEERLMSYLGDIENLRSDEDLEEAIGLVATWIVQFTLPPEILIELPCIHGLLTELRIRRLAEKIKAEVTVEVVKEMHK